MSTPRFLADEMLGKLARELRILGIDAAYTQHVEDDELLEQARREDRLLLTRDQQLAERAGDAGIMLSSRDPQEQLDRVLDAVELSPTAEAFLSRCLECNVELEESDDRAGVPEDVRDRSLWRCRSCERTYWHGTHVEDMAQRLARHLENEPGNVQIGPRASPEEHQNP